MNLRAMNLEVCRQVPGTSWIRLCQPHAPPLFFFFLPQPPYLALNCSSIGSQKKKRTATLWADFTYVNHFPFYCFQSIVFFKGFCFYCYVFVYVCIHLIQFLCQFFALQVSASFDPLVYKVKSRFLYFM